MATAAIAGIAVYGAASGAAAGSFIAVNAVAIAAAAAIAAGAADYMIKRATAPDASDGTQQVQLGDSANSIDKTALQQEADIGKLDIGEAEKDKKKRKKGKAKFKIALDQEAKAAGDAGSDTGLQVNKPEKLGVQL